MVQSCCQIRTYLCRSLLILEFLEDLGLVVKEVGDLHHPPPHVKLVLQYSTDHLKLLTLLDELRVLALLLEVLVTAEHLC